MADFHRNLIKGGIFMYPATTSNPEGKLRLLYEAFPLAYIAEAMGAPPNGHRHLGCGTGRDACADPLSSATQRTWQRLRLR